jgi:hypothetical protein
MRANKYIYIQEGNNRSAKDLEKGSLTVVSLGNEFSTFEKDTVVSSWEEYSIAMTGVSFDTDALRS